MEKLDIQNSTNEAVKRKEKALFVALGLSTVVVIILAIIGFLLINKEDTTMQGEVDANSVRVSGLMPGRVEKLYVKEGDVVHTGDTLAKIYSATVDAKLAQALAAKDAAEAMSRKANAGTRRQTVAAAKELVEQAQASVDIHRKTYERLEALYKQDVVTAQKRDEARAAYDAAVAQLNAAKQQYDMALEGAQIEDRQAAEARAKAAAGTVAEVESIIEDQYLVAPCDGEISDIFPHEGELVSTGTPIMNVLKLDDKWLVFNIRETDLQRFTVGSSVKVHIPALAMKEAEATVYYVKDMGEYATWRATKVTGQYDSKTFEVRMRLRDDLKELRPGMSVIVK